MDKHFIRSGNLCRTHIRANNEHEDQAGDAIASIVFIYRHSSLFHFIWKGELAGIGLNFC